jgi:hypothetical protein
MAIAYEWKIEAIETAKVEDGMTDVAKTVHWRMNAQDGDLSATAYGSVGLDAPTAEGFIAFDALSKAEVVAWVVDKLEMSEADIQAALAQRIAYDRDPPIISKLPAGW